MNKQGPKKIDWCDYTWNPISGCLHDCFYCYMHRMEERFSGIMRPAFHFNRLSQPTTLKKPSLIFAGSSGDMWGKWVPTLWIDAVLKICESTPWHTYQFLTKNPARYFVFKTYQNCWYGTTVDGLSFTANNINDLVTSTENALKFVSFEPLLTEIVPDLSGINWVIIGADSTRGAKEPPKEWADTIIKIARKQGISVFIKDNYHYPERIKEMPIKGEKWKRTKDITT